jgi:hypothetical protein
MKCLDLMGGTFQSRPIHAMQVQHAETGFAAGVLVEAGEEFAASGVAESEVMTAAEGGEGSAWVGAELPRSKGE